MGIVDLAVKLLDNLQELVPVLIQLGLRHNAYKVDADVVESASDRTHPLYACVCMNLK